MRLGFAATSTLNLAARRCPQQLDGRSCGVYCLVAAAFVIAGLPLPDAVDPDLWRQVLAELLVGQDNGEGDGARSFGVVSAGMLSKRSAKKMFMMAFGERLSVPASALADLISRALEQEEGRRKAAADMSRVLAALEALVPRRSDLERRRAGHEEHLRNVHNQILCHYDGFPHEVMSAAAASATRLQESIDFLNRQLNTLRLAEEAASRFRGVREILARASDSSAC